jgi:hypothetical protein
VQRQTPAKCSPLPRNFSIFQSVQVILAQPLAGLGQGCSRNISSAVVGKECCKSLRPLRGAACQHGQRDVFFHTVSIIRALLSPLRVGPRDPGFACSLDIDAAPFRLQQTSSTRPTTSTLSQPRRCFASCTATVASLRLDLQAPPVRLHTVYPSTCSCASSPNRGSSAQHRQFLPSHRSSSHGHKAPALYRITVVSQLASSADFEPPRRPPAALSLLPLLLSSSLPLELTFEPGQIDLVVRMVRGVLGRSRHLPKGQTQFSGFSDHGTNNFL